MKLTGVIVLLAVTFVVAQRQGGKSRSTTRSGFRTTTVDESNDVDEPTTEVAPHVQQAKINIRPATFKTLVTSATTKPTTKRISPGSQNFISRGGMSEQKQSPWAAIDSVRGRPALLSTEIIDILEAATPGLDFPLINEIPPAGSFKCEDQKQPGFYADPNYKCQVFRRCDPDGNLFSFLCPNTTIFNQVTLTCDWFFNVDCSRAVGFYDFSNGRLYHEDWPLLGDKV